MIYVDNIIEQKIIIVKIVLYKSLKKIVKDVTKEILRRNLI
jgi:hypothetical protein